jgi:prolyl oligopeptidase
MKHRLGLVFLLAVSALALADAPKGPPPTKTDNVKDTLHGVEITDPYRWLEDQKSPETRAWINAQNEYTETLLNPLATRDKLKQRLTELLKIDSIGMPTEAGGRYFFSKRLANQDLAVIYVREGLTGKDEVLIDPHGLSKDKTTSVNLMSVSDDGKLLAYGIRQGGEDEVAVQLFDVDARKDMADKLPRARYFGVSIRPDRKGFYYTRFGKEGPRVHYHIMGNGPKDDPEIFGKGYGPEKIISASLSENGKHLLISVMYGSAPKKIELYHIETKNKKKKIINYL